MPNLVNSQVIEYARNRINKPPRVRGCSITNYFANTNVTFLDPFLNKLHSTQSGY